MNTTLTLGCSRSMRPGRTCSVATIAVAAIMLSVPLRRLGCAGRAFKRFSRHNRISTYGVVGWHIPYRAQRGRRRYPLIGGLESQGRVVCWSRGHGCPELTALYRVFAGTALLGGVPNKS